MTIRISILDESIEYYFFRVTLLISLPLDFLFNIINRILLKYHKFFSATKIAKRKGV